jgi:hypothetical protein
MAPSKPTNLAHCDRLLLESELLLAEIAQLASNMPPGTSNTTDYLLKTVDCQRVVVSRLSIAFSLIRRYDHA